MSFVFGSKRRIIEKFITSKSASEIVSTWGEHAHLLHDTQLIISSPDQGINHIPHIIKFFQSFDSSDYLVKNFFKYERLFFFNNEIVAKLKRKELSQIFFGVEILIDTNIASEIGKIISGKLSKDSAQAKTILEIFCFCKSNGIPFNVLPYFIENEEKDNHAIFFDTIKSFFIFTTLNVLFYKNNGEFKFDYKEEDVCKKTQDILDSRNTDVCKGFLITYICIGWAIYIELTSKKNAREKIGLLVDGVIEEAGVLPLNEFVECSKFLFSRRLNPQMNVINRPFLKNKDYVSILKNIAWDYTISRLVGLSGATLDINKFHIPFLFTKDKRMAHSFESGASSFAFFARDSFEFINYSIEEEKCGIEYIDFLTEAMKKHCTEEKIIHRGKSKKSIEELKICAERMETHFERLVFSEV